MVPVESLLVEVLFVVLEVSALVSISIEGSIFYLYHFLFTLSRVDTDGVGNRLSMCDNHLELDVQSNSLNFCSTSLFIDFCLKTLGFLLN